jgi:DNA end-binding protein Ku
VPRRQAKVSEEQEERGARPFWSGTLTFGLVSVPVDLYPGHRTSRTPFRMIGPEGVPLARRYYSQKTGKDLDADQVIRGYEIDKDKYVVVTDDELERLAPEQSRDIDLRSFVDLESIPPIYFDRSYFLVPSKGSEKAYKLLAETMEKSDLAGIATFVMRGKEYLVAIFPENGILRAETMRFADELRTPKEVGLPEKKKVPAAAVKKFETIISKHSARQLPVSKLKDEYAAKLRKLVSRKRTARKNVIHIKEAEREEGKVVDLLDVLKKSLSGKKQAA